MQLNSFENWYDSGKPKEYDNKVVVDELNLREIWYKIYNLFYENVEKKTGFQCLKVSVKYCLQFNFQNLVLWCINNSRNGIFNLD